MQKLSKLRDAKVLILAILAIATVTSMGYAFAQSANGTNTGNLPIPSHWSLSTLLTFSVGAIWAGFGYAVAATKGETFDPVNFFSAVVIGVIIAILTTFGSAGFIDPTLQLALTTIFTIVVDKIFGKKGTSLVAKPPQKIG